MAALIEKAGSRRSKVSVESPEVELLYAVRGTEDDLEVRAAVEAEIGYLYNLVSGLGVQQLVFQDYSVDHQGGGVWDVSVRYGKREALKPAADGAEGNEAGTQTEQSSSFSFDTTGGTAHITQSLETVGSYAAPADPPPVPPAVEPLPPDMQGAIGVNGDNVDGCDIVVPAYAFSETHYIPKALVTGGYKGRLFLLTGKVNRDTFVRPDGQSFAPGTCQFLGASGSQRGKEDWEITYKFTCQPNVTGITVGRITGIAKKGFEYLWIRYADVSTRGNLVKRPRFAYVERVIEYGDFAQLGVGT